jgi:hypothetical protein
VVVHQFGSKIETEEWMEQLVKIPLAQSSALTPTGNFWEVVEV